MQPMIPDTLARKPDEICIITKNTFAETNMHVCWMTHKSDVEHHCLLNDNVVFPRSQKFRSNKNFVAALSNDSLSTTRIL